MNVSTFGKSIVNYSETANSNHNGNSRAIQEASDRKARMVTFYKNGEPFSSSLTVSIMPGKDFRTLEQLCAYLTTKVKVVNGVQYIFTTTGQRVCTLNELEHGQCYVVSGSKTFHRHLYGQTGKAKQNFATFSRQSFANKPKSIREDDLKLLRPLSSKFNSVYGSVNNNNSNPLREGRIITIVNNKDHKLKSKVLLNLKSPKSFEIIVKDLGQAIRIKNAKRMFTVSGQEVRSVSQLKRDMADIDLFYLDTNDTNNSNEKIKSLSYESIHTSNHMFSTDKHILNNQKSKILRNDSAPNLPNFDIKSPIGSDINSYRKGESRMTYNVAIESTCESDSPKSFKANETQTSPEFVRSSRRKAKKMLKDKSAQLESNGQIEEITRIDTKESLKNDMNNNSNKKTEEIFNKVQHFDKSHNDDNLKIIDHTNILQEYAETLLRETALMVQRDNFQNYDSDKSDFKTIFKVNSKASPKIYKPSHTPKKSISNIEKDAISFRSNSNSLMSDSIENITNELASNKDFKNAEFNLESHKKSNLNIGIKGKKLSEVSETPKITDVNELIENHLDEYKINKTELKFSDGINTPDKNLKLKWIHGFSGNRRKSLFVLTNGELAFFVGTVGVLWNEEHNYQRFYTEHNLDIECMAVRQSSDIIATSQKGGKKSPFAVIRIWSSKDLSTYSVFTKNIFGSSILDIVFAQQGFLLVVNYNENLNLTVWNWKKIEVLASASKSLHNDESVIGMTLHSTDDIIVTYGKRHLSLWQIKKDGTIDNRNAIKTNTRTEKTINCVTFLADHSLLTGDNSGILTIWAPLEDESKRLEFVVKEVKAHEKSLISVQLMVYNNILITGDREGTIKTWDVNEGQFRLLNAIKLPSTSGSINTIAIAGNCNKESDLAEIYICTSMNQILRGSPINTTNYTIIFEGHSLAIRGLASDPKSECFYSASLDQKICKWNNNALIWKTTTEFQCVAAAVHPNGAALATGSVSGTIFILNTSDGNLISHLPICQVCIGCLAFSADGDLLAAGCQDGVLYILPVYENGFVYEKVSVLKGPFAILSIQWSSEGQYILTSVNDNNYQELILWDLPNCRYMRGVSSFSDTLKWCDATCSGGEDVRGIWDNQNLQEVVNLSCHRSYSDKYIVTGDEDGCIRIFSYPCVDFKASFFEYSQGGGSVTETKFLRGDNYVVSSNYEGSIFVWQLTSFKKNTEKDDNS